MRHTHFLTDLPTAALQALPDWWQHIDDNPKWQQYSFVGLSIGYGLVALVALVQLIRIQQRVPEYGWTTQKVFHLLNAFVYILRCVVFALRDKVSCFSTHSLTLISHMFIPNDLFLVLISLSP